MANGRISAIGYWGLVIPWSFCIGHWSFPPGHWSFQPKSVLAVVDRTAIAIGAHPDDIEFYMAGTLLLLKEAGYEIHYMTVASGSCGSLQESAAVMRRVRRKESERAASILGAHYHRSLTDDLEI